jgi:hypothetical protein
MSFLQTYLTLIPPALAFHSILALLRVMVWQKHERWCNVLGTATVLPLAFISLMASRYAVTVPVDGFGGGDGSRWRKWMVLVVVWVWTYRCEFLSCHFWVVSRFIILLREGGC